MSDADLEREDLRSEDPAADQLPTAAAAADETSAPQPENSIFPLYPDPRVEETLPARDAEHVSEPPFSPAPDDQVPPPPPRRDKKKVLRIAAVALAVVVVLGVAAAFAVPAILQAVNPRAYVSACLARTAAAYSGGGDVAAVLAGLQKQPSRTEFYFQMNDPAAEAAADPSLPDLRYTASIEADYPNRRVDLELGLSYLGNAMSLLAIADDNLVSFGSDSLTGGDYYCINTETLGADVAASPVFRESFELDPTFGFNLFDAVPTETEETPSLDPGTLSLLTQFYGELDKAITVEKSGSSTVTVLGQESTTTRYIMTIPAEALRGFVVQSLRALTEDETFLSTANFTSITPEEFVDVMDQALSTIKDAVTIDFYIAGGKVLLLDAALPMEQEGQVVTTHLKTEFHKDGSALVASLTAAKEDTVSGGLVLSYAKDGENFDLTLVVSDESGPTGDIHVVGTFLADKAAKSFALDLSEISFTSEDETVTLGMGLSVALLDGFSHELPTDPIPLLEMDEEAFYNLLIQALSGVSAVFSGDAGYSY